VQRWLSPPPRAAASEKQQQLKAVVHLVHGLSAHGSAYATLARALVAEGYVVVAHDAHGHGRSDGFRGHACSVEHYVDDARVAVAEARRRLPAATNSLPRILLGHSLGGAVAIHLAAATRPCEWAGVVLTAPAVAVYSNPLLRLFAPILATFAPLMPVQRVHFDHARSRKSQRLGAPAAAAAATAAADAPLSSIRWTPWARRAGRRASTDATAEPQGEDPLLLRGPVRARLGYEVLKSCARIMRCAPTFRAPVFVAHSRGDRATAAQGSIDFVSKIASPDKSIKLYEGDTHDLLAARGRQHKRFVRDIIEWMNKRVERHPATCPSPTRGRGGRRSGR
jgi:acylglycerol lipase